MRLEATDTFPSEQGAAICLAVAWSPQVTRPVVLPLSSLCEAPLDGSSFIEHLSAPWGGSIVPIREPGSSRTRWRESLEALSALCERGPEKGREVPLIFQCLSCRGQSRPCCLLDPHSAWIYVGTVGSPGPDGRRQGPKRPPTPRLMGLLSSPGQSRL